MSKRLVTVDCTNEHLVSYFLKEAGTSLVSFRYFDKRDLSVLKNHLVTYVLLNDDNVPIGYGHLDRDDNDVWLGIALVENEIGKGNAKFILNALFDFARKNRLTEIKLSVDKNNERAKALYKQFGFIEVTEKESIFIYSAVI